MNTFIFLDRESLFFRAPLTEYIYTFVSHFVFIKLFLIIQRDHVLCVVSSSS